MAPISFARGAPAPECLDPALIADCARAALERDGVTVLSYGTGGGYGPLREVLAERHGVEPGRVYLTTGGLQGFVFYAAVQLAVRPGRVLVEGPTYDRPLKILARDGAEVVPLAMDDEGLDLDALEAELAKGGPVSFLYTIPTFQNPSGRTIGTERRRRLVEIAAAHDLPILEDDPYGRVRYDGEPLPSIHELEGGERVTFTSSFSKTVAPGLRIGYFVVPQALVSSYDDQAVSTYISPSLLPQATVFELIDRGAFEPNLDRVRGLLKARKDAMLAALAAEMPDGTRWSSPEGGYFLWLDFDESVDAAALADAGDRGGRDVRAWLGLLPGRLGRPLVGAARVQLRVARAHRRGRRAPRLAAVARRDRPRRDPPPEPRGGRRFYGHALRAARLPGRALRSAAASSSGTTSRSARRRRPTGDATPPRRLLRARRRRRSTPGGEGSPPRATRATALPGHGPPTARTTTAPSSSTRRATASRP